MKEFRIVTLYSEELKREVKLHIYLPKSYDKTEKFYPVLYMHDGHNLFDDAYAYDKSWGILEAYEKHPELPEIIIVGLDQNVPTRNDELLPAPFYDEESNIEFKALADDYLKFLTKVVKPYIDKRFRTFKSPKNTALMGSSLGGVCTTYAACEYQQYFSRFGCVSNAYYVIQDFMVDLVEQATLNKVKKIYMDVGTKETSGSMMDEQDYINCNKEIAKIVESKTTKEQFQFHIIEGAEHNEIAWEKRFPYIIQFLFND